MQPDFDVFYQRLREAIGKESMYGWAVRVGINKGSLNGAITRRSIPKVDMLAHMSKALGKPIDWLLGIDLLSTGDPTTTTEPTALKIVRDTQHDNDTIDDSSLVFEAVLAVERGIQDITALDLETRSNLISLAFDALLFGKSGEHLEKFIHRLNSIVSKNSLTKDERMLLEIYRAAPQSRKRLMITPLRNTEAGKIDDTGTG